MADEATFDPMKHLRKRRWLLSLTSIAAAILFCVVMWAADVSISAGWLVAMVGASAFIGYRRGAEDMHELWSLHEAGREAKII